MTKEEKLLEEERRLMWWYLCGGGVYDEDFKRVSDAFIIKYQDGFEYSSFLRIIKGKKKRSSKVYQLILDKLYNYYKENDYEAYLRSFLIELIPRKRLSKRFLEKNKDKIPQSVWEELYK